MDDVLRQRGTWVLRQTGSFARWLTVATMVPMMWAGGLVMAEDTNKAEQRPELVIPFMKEAPVIDGVIQEAEWACTKVKGFISQSRANHIEFRDGEFWLGWDEQRLYLAVRSAVHPEVGLVAETKPKPGGGDAAKMGGDDTVELFFAPNVRDDGKASKAGQIYQIIFNGNGAVYDLATDKVKNTFDTSWRARMQLASSVRDGYWHAEAAIEFASMPGGTLEDTWGVRVCRNFKNPWDQSRFGINVLAFSEPETMPRVRFSRSAPIVKQQSLHNDTRDAVALRVSLGNPTATPLPLKVTLGQNPINQPRYYKIEEITLAPGETREVSYGTKVQDPDNYPAAAVIKVAAADGSRLYFARDFLWDLRPKAAIWTPVPKADVKAVTIDLGHYPSLRQLAVRGSFANLKGKEAVKAVALAVTKAGATEVLARQEVREFTEFGFEAVLALPEGMDGDYQLAAILSGDASTPNEPLVVPFERRRFAWENNRIGISDEVIPPFTPLVVDRDRHTVSAILRQHRLAPTGLFAQVVADGEELLAAPMEYQVVANGVAQPVVPAALQFTMTAPHRVVVQGAFTAGPLQADVSVDFDYDGMMQTTLNLRQQGHTPIDRFDLIIPLKTSVARLMHPLTDGMRFNYGGMVPPGNGVVWESRQAAKNLIVGPFVPYFWFGNEYRGLCWFAESDKGWKTDDAKSALTLERTGAAVVLKVHFVNQPGAFTVPTQIVFGLMASPAKPLTRDPAWQNVTVDGGGAHNLRVMGSSFYWNGQMYANFPQNRDFTAIRKFADANKLGQVDRAFFDALVANWSEKTHDLDFDYNKSHILNGGSPHHYTGIVPYTNLRGDLTWIPEWRTFQDEWSFTEFNKRVTDRDRLKGSTDFAIVPVRSRQDFLLFYYQKFLESGFDGIYWDNIYLQSCFSSRMGPAYTRADGQKQPYMDVFHSRELLKRTAVLSHQMGRKLNVSMVHMTNTNLVPVFSFAGSLLGWEWRYGMTDFQDRFTPDYIRAVNLPFNTGCIPVQLGGIRGSEDKAAIAWCERTRAGVTLVHELQVWSPDAKLIAIRKMLAEFGYGTDAVTAYRYWDGEPLAKAVDSLKWLVLAKPGKAVVIAVDYGDGGDISLDLDGQRLRLADGARAVDWESGEPVALAAGNLRFTLKRHDYRIVVIETGAP